MAVSIQVFTFNAFREKTYVLFNREQECIIIDPGCMSWDEQHQLACFIQAHALTVKYIINTHVHLDHIWGNHFLQTTYNAQLVMHLDSLPLLEKAADYQNFYGFNGYQPATPSFFVDQGDSIAMAGWSLTVLHVPGHAPGHIALYSEHLNSCFSGDVLFKGAIGRPDLWGGDHETLCHSIRTKLFTLPNDVVIYPGHGHPTTVKQEKEHLRL